MTVKVNPIVVFDHYFTEIDESLVETSDLLVKTSDSSVFTKNTNVVSNFDDVYIIECSSVEEARYVYSYYVDKVDSISDLSKVISIATDENDEDVADLADLNDGNDARIILNKKALTLVKARILYWSRLSLYIFFLCRCVDHWAHAITTQNYLWTRKPRFSIFAIRAYISE